MPLHRMVAQSSSVDERRPVHFATVDSDPGPAGWAILDESEGCVLVGWWVRSANRRDSGRSDTRRPYAMEREGAGHAVVGIAESTPWCILGELRAAFAARGRVVWLFVCCGDSAIGAFRHTKRFAIGLNTRTRSVWNNPISTRGGGAQNGTRV